MIVPVLFFLLSVRLCITQSLNEGDSCRLTNRGPGVCTALEQCPSVFERLQEGNPPDVVCGYSGFTPIVCCPKSAFESTTTRAPTESAQERGVISRQKCAEYSKYTWALQHAPTLLQTDHQLLNRSLCAIMTSSWNLNKRNANRMEYPYMAAVGYDLKTGSIGWHCGGALISETFVLTAAHCTYLREWGDAAWVRVGDLNLERSDDGAAPVDRRITERIRHPDFKSSLQYHDIALLRLETRVPFNGWIRPACLHTTPLTGTQKAIVTGWGVDEYTDDGSLNVRVAALPLVDPHTCNTNWASGTVNSKLPNGVVENWSICAAAEEKDSCQDEAGAVLVIYAKKEYCMYDIVGVMGQRKLCNGLNPGIYTRVYHYVEWIESIVWG